MATVNSARSNYRDVVGIADAADGNRFKTLANVQVEVRNPGTVVKATIYGSRNPADLTPLANPLTTDATGIINFWAEVGEYDLFFHDTVGPARIADQTIGWSAVSPVTKGIPTAALRDDAAIGFTSLGADTMRQHVPIGSVIDWWRPFSTYDAGAGAGNAPPGYEICDGHTVAAGSHDFGGGSPITLPDLRNKFVIGADIAAGKADGTASTAGDGTAAFNAQHPNAPGIRGVGGANATRNLNHTHSFAHTHGVAGVDHLHSVGSYSGQGHYHQITGGTGYEQFGSSYAGGGDQFTNSIATPHAHSMDFGSGGDSAHGVTGASGAADRSLATTTNSQSTTTTAGDTSSAAADMRPSHYGLLKIMKVRRS
jgi:hypothetical protein